MAATAPTGKATGKLPWPKALPEQAKAIRAALGAPADAKAVAQQFKGAQSARVQEILDTLASLGQARLLPGGRYAAV